MIGQVAPAIARLSRLHQRIGDKAAGTIVVVSKAPYALFRR
jgi:hypothetical protein